MSTIRERLDALREKRGIRSNSDLLRRIYPLLDEKDREGYTDVEHFVEQTKGSFSQMLDGKNGRELKTSFYVPLEIVLNTSMAYLLKGEGESIREKGGKGIRYAAMTDTEGNYITLENEGVYMESDEYGHSLVDYMIEYKSKNGFEYFAASNELPINEIGQFIPHYGKIDPLCHDGDDLLDAIVDLCSLETVLGYFDGYRFINSGVDPRSIGDDQMTGLLEGASRLIRREDLRHALSDYKVISLKKPNPSLVSIDGHPVGESGFVNLFFTMMLEWAISCSRDTTDSLCIELLDKAYELNEKVMPIILSLPYERYRVGDYGFVYSGRDLCGSIAYINRGFYPEKPFTGEALEKLNRLNAQIETFNEKIGVTNRVSIMGAEMQVQKQDNEVFYEFYRLMNESKCEFIPIYQKDKSASKDVFILPMGEKTSLPNREKPQLYTQALNVLSKIDAISAEALGGKVYIFPELNSRSFFAVGDFVTGIAPTIVSIGERYDNLAEFLSQTILIVPYFQVADDQLKAFATSLKEYGIKKKDLGDVLESFKTYFQRSASSFDVKTARGKQLYANAHARIVWIDLFKGDIKEQFK